MPAYIASKDLNTTELKNDEFSLTKLGTNVSRNQRVSSQNSTYVCEIAGKSNSVRVQRTINS